MPIVFGSPEAQEILRADREIEADYRKARKKAKERTRQGVRAIPVLACIHPKRRDER